MKIVYDSNGQPVGDGDRITRVENDGTSFSVMVDAKTRRFAKIKFVDDGAIPAPAPAPEPTPIPPPPASPNTGTAYVAPGGPAGDGTFAKPFPSVHAAVQAGVKSTITLLDGWHGALEFKGSEYAFASDMRIVPQNPGKAECGGVLAMIGAKNISVEGLVMYKPDGLGGNIVTVYSDASHIKIRNCAIRSRKDVAGFLSWASAQWTARALPGIVMDGAYGEVTGNTLDVVAFGMSVGSYGVMAGNTITNHSADAMRAGSFATVRGNKTANGFQVDGNHADGFQAIAGPSGVLPGLQVIDNDINEWTHADRNHPLRATMQGIGLYDGFYDDLIIRGNRVYTGHSHGISVYGARRSTIDGNVVTKADRTTNTPWIAFFPHKNGTPGSGNILTNNTAPQFGSKSGVVTDTGNKIA